MLSFVLFCEIIIWNGKFINAENITTYFSCSTAISDAVLAASCVYGE
jgi:hypothetical protein